MQYEAERTGLPARSLVRRWVAAALACAGEVTVRFVDSAEARSLNARYRGQDRATNVLSFGYAPPPRLAGDLAVCVPLVREEARQQGKALEAHFAHLIVHGMLHLHGYEHERDADAKIMEQRERRIMVSLGYGDPYERWA